MDIDALQARIRAVLHTSLSQNDSAERVQRPLTDAAHNAPLYFKQPIPSWPPRFLLQKMVRRLLLPALGPQVACNEAVVSILFSLQSRGAKQQQAARDTQERVNELEHQVEALKQQVAALLALPQGGSPPANLIPPASSPSALPENALAAWSAVLPVLMRELNNSSEKKPSPLFFGNGVALSGSVAKRKGDGSLPRMAFVSPFPPQQSGVADYSEEIAAPLRKHYDLDLFTDDGYTPRLLDGSETLPLSIWERMVNIKKREYCALVYQMGNNQAFHAQMYVMLLKWAGITVLHDYSLSHLLMGIALERPDLEVRYETELAHEVGQSKAADLMREINAGRLRHEDLGGMGIYLNRRVFTRSLGVVLHNQYGYDLAQAHALDNPLITLIPPVMPPVKLDHTQADVCALREKWGVPLDAFVFAPCGIVTPTKRPLPILDAFARLLAERPDAFLLFVGSVSMPLEVDFEAEIEKRGLTHRVKITGYVDVPTFNEYLLLSDVCVTLRFPSQGETSGALLRMLVHGKPSIVTAIGSFDDFPDDTVHKLPTPDKMADEVGEITQAFRLLANNAAYRKKIAANGLAYILREHSPEHCARLYARFVDEVVAHPETRRKLLADWAGRDIARRVQNSGANGDALLAELAGVLHAASPQ